MLNQERKQVRIHGNNLAISGDPDQDWFIGWTPGQDAFGAEGTWDEWVQLAMAILHEERNRLNSKT